MTSGESVISFLREKNINFSEHLVESTIFPPGKQFWKDRDMLRCKNLFFRDNHGRNHYLLIFNYYKKINIKSLQEITGRGSMTMASHWRVEKYLGLKPGFISVFGLLNDSEKHVKVIIDKELDQEKELSFLPNTEGERFISLGFKELKEFLKNTGHEYQVEDLGD